MKRPYVLLTLTLVAFAIVGVSLSFRKDSGHSITLPDGKVVELLGIAVGHQQFTTEKPWHKHARRWLPSRLHGWIPATASSMCSSGTNSITVYFNVSHPSGAAITGMPWHHYRIEDASGFLYNGEGGLCGMRGGGSGLNLGQVLLTFPRREPSFRFHFIDQSDAIMATLNIPNPIRASYADWKAQPLPQTQSNGPVALTLEAIREVDSSTYRLLNPQWSLRALMPEWERAKVQRLTFFDATGNEGRWLSPHEPAWKVHAEVHREPFEDFSADEKVTFTNLWMPTNGGFTSANIVQTCLGVRLRLYAVAASARFFVTNGVRPGSLPYDGTGYSRTEDDEGRVESWSGKNHFVLLESEGSLYEHIVRLRLLSDHGQEIPSTNQNSRWECTQQAVMHRLDFSPHPDTKFISLEAIVSRPLHFDFIVNPKEVVRSQPSSHQ